MQTSTPLSARFRPLAVAVTLTGAVLALVLLLPAFGEPGRVAAARGKHTGEKVRVMVRNLYLGANLRPACCEVDSFSEFTAEAADIFQELQRTDFPSRAKLLAREIKRANPDLVGLQEASIWRLDTTEEDGTDSNDGDLSATPANEPLYDFLPTLISKLKAAGANYRVVDAHLGLDIELPVDERPSDLHEDPTDPYYDGRFTFGDAILARKGAGIRTSNMRSGDYKELLTPKVAGVLEVPIVRGWESVQANVRGQRFRFVNTHLEAYDDGTIRRDQAKELVNGPAKSKGDVVLVGDFNSGLRKEHNVKAPRDQLAYRVIDRAGFRERQTDAFTCCYGGKLNNPRSKLDHSIDFVFVNNPRIKLGRSFITGDDPKQRTATGLWPADHGGVVSDLIFP